MRLTGLLVFTNLIIISPFMAAGALANDGTKLACIADYLTNPRPLSEDEVNAEQVVRRVATAVGVTRKIQVIPCSFASKALAWRAKEAADGVPRGDYIIYKPEWVREIIGKDADQAAALFGHELAHFLNDDFTADDGAPSVEKEKQADKFAGCAVARMGGELSKVEDLLSRIRTGDEGAYPTRLASIDAAKEGFVACQNLKVDLGKEHKEQSGQGCSNTFEGLTIAGSKIGMSMPDGSRTCVKNAQIAATEIGVQIRDALKMRFSSEDLAGLKKYCRVMWGGKFGDTKEDFIYPMAPEKRASDCAARARFFRGKFAQMACGDTYHSDTFSASGDNHTYPKGPIPNCGWAEDQ